MALSEGTRLGVYEVVGLIGQGGMGEVYQARDTTLDRDVALKVLPEAFTADPDRLARFEREAKVLASLNHPNIGSIYGLEEAEGVKALVLELVEGPTLADQFKQGPIPIDEALPIAKQIAEAREQHPEPNDRAWSTGLVCHPAVKAAGSGRFSLLSGSCTNRIPAAAVAGEFPLHMHRNSQEDRQESRIP